MSITNLQSLPIEDALRLKLSGLLEQFESYRIHNDLNNSVVVEEERIEDSTPKKKRRISFLEKLFITEYDE